MNGNHLKYMLLGGAGVLGALLLLNVPLQGALLVAVVMACPLMMVFMMGHGGHGADKDERDSGAGRGGHHH